MKHTFFSLCLFLFFTSCSSDESVNSNSDEESVEAQYFPNFPDSPFLSIEFGEPMKVVEAKLEKEGLREQDFQKGDWRTDDENVEVLIDETDLLGNFKLFFFNQNDSFLEDLEGFFNEKNKKVTKNDNFAIYNFNSLSEEFTVSVFQYDNVIRLEYKLTLSH